MPIVLIDTYSSETQTSDTGIASLVNTCDIRQDMSAL